MKNLSNMPIIMEILRFTQNDNKRVIMKTNLKSAYAPSGGEGVADAAGTINHKALNLLNFIPSHPMGEKARVRGQ